MGPAEGLALEPRSLGSVSASPLASWVAWASQFSLDLSFLLNCRVKFLSSCDIGWLFKTIKCKLQLLYTCHFCPHALPVQPTAFAYEAWSQSTGDSSWVFLWGGPSRDSGRGRAALVGWGLAVHVRATLGQAAEPLLPLGHWAGTDNPPPPAIATASEPNCSSGQLQGRTV